MEVQLAHSLDEALAMKGERPEATPIAGGTDLMVDLNFGRRRPPAVIDVSRVSDFSPRREENGQVFRGAGVPYATIVKEMPAFKPLVQASRSVGSPQIRNRGPVGGNRGQASRGGARGGWRGQPSPPGGGAANPWRDGVLRRLARPIHHPSRPSDRRI